MKWYLDRLAKLEKTEPIISVCGDDCAVCPRYLAETEDELRETAVFWYKAGWRDHIVSNEEISCSGCGCRPICGFMLLPCTREHGVKTCRDCSAFECDKIKRMYALSDAKKGQCERACDSPEEFRMLCRAFYEKEKNLRSKK